MSDDVYYIIHHIIIYIIYLTKKTPKQFVFKKKKNTPLSRNIFIKAEVLDQSGNTS